MLISQAFAHGVSGDGVGSAVGPMILLAVAALAVLFYVVRSRWLKRRSEPESDAGGE